MMSQDTSVPRISSHDSPRMIPELEVYFEPFSAKLHSDPFFEFLELTDGAGDWQTEQIPLPLRRILQIKFVKRWEVETRPRPTEMAVGSHRQLLGH